MPLPHLPVAFVCSHADIADDLHAGNRFAQHGDLVSRSIHIYIVDFHSLQSVNRVEGCVSLKFDHTCPHPPAHMQDALSHQHAALTGMRVIDPLSSSCHCHCVMRLNFFHVVAAAAPYAGCGACASRVATATHSASALPRTAISEN